MAVETLDELNTTVADLIWTVTGIRQIIKAEQDKAPPETLYGTYNIIPVRAYGQAKKVRTDAAPLDPVPSFSWQDIDEATITQMELMVSINFFNTGAKQAAHRMVQSQFREAVASYCRQNDLAWRYVSEPRNMLALEMATLQERYQIDLHLWVETQITDTIMAAAGFSVELYDEDQNLLTYIDGTTGA